MRVRPIEVSASATITVSNPEAYRALLDTTMNSANVQFSRKIWKPGKRCAWGWRKGYVQVGSPEDAPDELTMTFPAANVQVDLV